MIGRIFKRYAGSGCDVLFLCSSVIDEVWVRSTAAACIGQGLAVRLVVCDGPLGNAPDAESMSFEAAARIKCPLVITASTGIDRLIFPTRASHLIHMPHSLASLHMIYAANTFDGYDALFSAGPHHDSEFAALGAVRGLAARPTIPIGYGKLDVLAAAHVSSHLTDVLIAPSWGPDNMLERFGVEVASALAARGLLVTVRPHPLFFIQAAPVIETLRTLGAGVQVESPFDGDDAMLTASVMVGDYSGASFEFAALRRRPVVSVDVGRKIVNPDWTSVGLEPVEVSLRSRLGPVVQADAEVIIETVADLASGNGTGVDDDGIAAFLHGAPGECGTRAAIQIKELLDAT